MMYCVTIVIVAAMICVTINLPTILELKAIKLKKLKETLENSERIYQMLEVKYDRVVTQQVKELTVLHDKLDRLMDKQRELTDKLEKGGKE